MTLTAGLPPTPNSPPIRSPTPIGRGYDWSHAGYKYGEALPNPPAPVTYTVTQPPYNARGDGVTDNSAAIRQAIVDANNNVNGGVIYFPAGTYVLREPVQVNRSNVVLRGAGVSGG